MTAALGLWLIVQLWNAPPSTLGEASLREAHRRVVVARATLVMTDADLPARPPEARPVVPATTVVADDDVPAKVTSTAAGASTRDETWWRAQVTAARNAVSRNQVLADALVSRLNALDRDIAARDDPAQRAALMTTRAEVLAEQTRLHEQARVDAKSLADILEEARTSGVPPGWLR